MRAKNRFGCLVALCCCLLTAHSSRALGADEPAIPPIEGWLDEVVLLTHGAALCSGVVVDGEGLVATAYHCVATRGRPHVRTRAGDSYRAHIVATWPRRDLALLKVPELAGVHSGLALRADALQPGEVAWGLGHPYGLLAEQSPALDGLLQWSISRGVVSAVGARYVQVDTPLNPGNSGGPLLDQEGRIIGIASRKLDADNIAFAAPATALASLMEEPRRSGWGGTLGLEITGVVAMDLRQASTLGPLVRVVLRDHLVVHTAYHLALLPRWLALEMGAVEWMNWELMGAGRLRLGAGRWSLCLDAGGGLINWQGLTAAAEDSSSGVVDLRSVPGGLAPALTGRLSLGGMAMRLIWIPEQAAVLTGIDLEFPGVLGVF